MLIEEDYFKDFEVTDDDIQLDDEPVNSDFPDNIQDLFSDLKAKNYKLSIQATLNQQLVRQYIIDDKTISNIAKRLYELFELYEIPHSPLYATSAMFNDLEHFTMPVFTQHDNFVEIDDKESYIHNYRGFYVFVDVIHITSIKKMLRLIQRMRNIIYTYDPKTKRRLMEYLSFNAFNERTIKRNDNLYCYQGAFRDETYSLDFNWKTDINQMRIICKTIEWFFGESVLKKFARLMNRDMTAEALNINEKPDKPYVSTHVNPLNIRKL